VAVGTLADSSIVATATETWDGTSWTSRATPYDAGDQATLTSVSCLSTDQCLAVGYDVSIGGPAVRLAWDGATWTSIPGPTVSDAVAAALGGGPYLLGIDCPDSTTCLDMGIASGAYGERFDAA
jgi:hypothetical protein